MGTNQGLMPEAQKPKLNRIQARGGGEDASGEMLSALSARDR